VLLPLCCFGSLPVAVGFRKKGVGLGAILAFLVATPATSLTAILVTTKLLGINFALLLCFSVVLIATALGFVGNLFFTKTKEELSEGCPHCEGEHGGHRHHKEGFKNRAVSILSFAFVDILREIGLEIIIGIALAAFVATISPISVWIKNYLGGGAGYLFAIIFGIITYICATATVPLVDSLINQGLPIGPGFLLLLIGPITSWSTLLVIRKEFGMRILLIYLGVICSLALLLAYLFSSFFFLEIYR
jgi:hypothetical protein